MHLTAFYTSFLLITCLSAAVPVHRNDVLLPRLTSSERWAGAVYDNCSHNTFEGVAGTFKLPLVTGPGFVTILVSLDGGSCGTSNFFAGVEVSFKNGPIYTAIYGWYPDTYTMSDFPLNGGDQIRITLVSFVKSPKRGVVSFENMMKDHFVQQNVLGETPLSRSNAAWVVKQSRASDGSQVPFCNFGSVTFTSTKAYLTQGSVGAITAANADLWQIINPAGSAIAIPSVTADGTVTVSYTG